MHKAFLISRFRIATGESALVAIDYLEAEEWDLDDALLSWRADEYLR